MLSKTPCTAIGTGRCRFGAGGWHDRYTLEGFATYTGPEEGTGFVRAYVMTFRTGVIEAAGVLGEQRDNLRLGQLEQHITGAWTRRTKVLERHGVEPPIYVMASLLNVGGRTMYVPPELSVRPAAYRRDNLLLPPFEVTTEKLTLQPTELFRPLFNTIANAFGLACSFNYRPDGRYAPL